MSGGDGDGQMFTTAGVVNVDGGAEVDVWTGNHSDLTAAFVLDAAAETSAGGVDIVNGHVSSVERYRLTTGSGNDVITHLSGSGNVIATNSGDDTVASIM